MFSKGIYIYTNTIPSRVKYFVNKKSNIKIFSTYNHKTYNFLSKMNAKYNLLKK